MTPWWVVDLALIVYCIGMLSLIAAGCALFYGFMEGVEAEEKDAEVVTEVVPFPRGYARTSCAPLGSRVRHERPRLRSLPGGRGSNGKD